MDNNDYCIYCEIYSTQLSADDPVCIDEIECLQEITDMLESLPNDQPYIMYDIYIDVCDLNDPTFQVTHSICGCRDLNRIHTFVREVWNNMIEGNGYI